MSVSPRLSIDALACIRGGRLLFRGVSLTLGPGGAAVVTGPNGTGKSSLLRVVAGLLPPAHGRVDRNGRIALMAEAPALDPELSVADALRFWARIDGNAGGVDAALATVGLSEIATVPVRLLSTGQRRRAALARVVASGAGIWLLDEPANGLDTASVAALEHAIAAHRADGGIAVIATHVPVEAPGAQHLALEPAA